MWLVLIGLIAALWGASVQQERRLIPNLPNIFMFLRIVAAAGRGYDRRRIHTPMP
jgi:hypothetical protein|tara:strand:+ start:1303 stop:1467 length:165 start_codon:yes stop_codon:yes gene_type:complete